MATAKKETTERIERTTTVTLVLSEDEATAVAVVLSRISGSVRTTAREHTDRVMTALDIAGVEWFASPMARRFTGYMTAE
ncbi:hypothetical protein ABZY06_33845 [Streptomyces sp. NPDC006540]|uniref:hypothetical protein n=1 Tax=Streptomyces sp. NPDC006540 TaxID=3155353 RepID=UPI0033BBDBC7